MADREIKTMADGSLPWSLAQWQQERQSHMAEHNPADLLSERLRAIGVQVKVEHATGEYTLSYANVQATARTLDLAVVLFVRELLKIVPVEKLL